jgi:hypothetical protein
MNIKQPHEVISLLFLAGVINYLDRSALSVAARLITKDFHLSPSELGFVWVWRKTCLCSLDGRVVAFLRLDCDRHRFHLAVSSYSRHLRDGRRSACRHK